MTSLIAPISQQFPEAKIDVVCGKDNAAVWQSDPRIDKLFVIPSRGILIRLLYALKIRAYHYELAIVVNGEHQGASFNLLRMVANLKNILWSSLDPIGKSTDTVLLKDWETGHYIERCNALTSHLCQTPIQSLPHIFLGSASLSFAQHYWLRFTTKPRVIINAGASTPDRQWSVNKIGQLATAIQTALPMCNLHVISQNTLHAKQLQEHIDAHQLSSYLHVIPPRKNIMDIAALMKDCDILLTPDTFATHFASAFNTPVVAVFLDRKKITTWGPLSDAKVCLFVENKVDSISDPVVSQAIVSLLKIPAKTL